MTRMAESSTTHLKRTQTEATTVTNQESMSKNLSWSLMAGTILGTILRHKCFQDQKMVITSLLTTTRSESSLKKFTKKYTSSKSSHKAVPPLH